MTPVEMEKLAADRARWIAEEAGDVSHEWPFLCDVDGVVLKFVAAVYAAIGLPRTLEETMEWDFVKSLPEPHQSLAWKALTDYDFWMSLEPLDDAIEGIEALRKIAPVVFVTSPYDSCKGWEHARRTLLKKHFNARRTDVIVTPRKELVRGRTLIDDKPEHWERWTKYNGGRFMETAGVLFDAPYNRSYRSPFAQSWCLRAVGWKEVLQKIAEHKL